LCNESGVYFEDGWILTLPVPTAYSTHIQPTSILPTNKIKDIRLPVIKYKMHTDA
jgi:hypothetical protein